MCVEGGLVVRGRGPSRGGGGFIAKEGGWLREGRLCGRVCP